MIIVGSLWWSISPSWMDKMQRESNSRHGSGARHRPERSAADDGSRSTGKFSSRLRRPPRRWLGNAPLSEGPADSTSARCRLQRSKVGEVVGVRLLDRESGFGNDADVVFDRSLRVTFPAGQVQAPASRSILLKPKMAKEVETGRFRTVAEIREWIAGQYGVTYTEGGAYSLMRRLQCSPKVPRPLHAKADEEQQASWKKGDNTCRKSKIPPSQTPERPKTG